MANRNLKLCMCFWMCFFLLFLLLFHFCFRWVVFIPSNVIFFFLSFSKSIADFFWHSFCRTFKHFVHLARCVDSWPRPLMRIETLTPELFYIRRFFARTLFCPSRILYRNPAIKLFAIPPFHPDFKVNQKKVDAVLRSMQQFESHS